VRTLVKVLLGSGTFVLASSAVYRLVGGETAGTVLLAGTGIATLVICGYVWLRGRRAPEAPADRGDAEPGEGAGETVASFTMGSPWPFVLGAGVALVAGGLVFGFPLLVLGALVVALAVFGMMRESVA
jgi:hypothetical protein